MHLLSYILSIPLYIQLSRIPVFSVFIKSEKSFNSFSFSKTFKKKSYNYTIREIYTAYEERLLECRIDM